MPRRPGGISSGKLWAGIVKAVCIDVVGRAAFVRFGWITDKESVR